jgi:hypothetical protein
MIIIFQPNNIITLFFYDLGVDQRIFVDDYIHP